MPARRTQVLGPDGSPLPDNGKEKLTFACAFPGCGQTYSRMEYLKRHQRKHQDERPFQCKDCSKAFARSDVLLRHRRRCHPTPPPRDRSSHSPMPQMRAHPSVPISSSRTSERDASPLRAGRKHPRDSASAADENPSSRPRLSPDAEDNDDDRFGSRFSRNGMGNGGVFGVTNNYYDGSPSEGNYASLFQNASGQFHNMNDPNHLEDASVLLSMAYPGGVPGSGNSAGDAASISPSQAAAALADATEVSDTPASNKHSDKDSVNGQSFSSGAVDNPARPAAPGALLPESMGNFTGISWLDGQDVTDSFMNDTPRPLSPFNINNLFSPSTFNVGLDTPGELSNETTALAIAAAAAAVTMPHANAQANGTSATSVKDKQQADANQVVAAILEQLAKNEVPETRGNPNPERPLLRLASRDVVVKAGEECPRSSRFYLPADRFAGCYQVPHWALPPLRTLSVMAAKTYYSVLNHFPFVHDPTFRLVDTTACLAFAICTVGGIRLGNNKSGLLLNGVKSAASSPISTGGVWEQVATEYSQGVDPENAEDRRRWQEWDAGNVVRNEKTNMLVKSFSLAKGVLMTEYNVALLQALILYHAPYFLSQNEVERRHANMFLGTIVNITRQIGFLQSNLEHADTTIHVPPSADSPADLDRAWKRWVQLEGRRRTAFLVYHLDTVSALESSISPILTPSELASLPLPAPDSVWKAATAQAWYLATRSYRPMTLDEAMRHCFGLSASGSLGELPTSNGLNSNLLAENEYGPFARTAIMLTLIRGIQDIGEGRRSRGDWRDLTDLWVSANHLRPESNCYSAEGVDLGPCSQEALRTRFALALQKWREGWQQDPSCSSTVMASSPSSSLLTPNFPSPGSTTSDGSPKPKGNLMYCEEAMPFFFLAASLLNKLSSAPSAGRNAFADSSYAELLEAARTLARAGGIQQQRVGVF